MFCHDHSGSVAGGGPGDYVPGGVSPDDIREHMIAWETTKDGYKHCQTCGEKSYIKHDSWRKSTFCSGCQNTGCEAYRMNELLAKARGKGMQI